MYDIHHNNTRFRLNAYFRRFGAFIDPKELEKGISIIFRTVSTGYATAGRMLGNGRFGFIGYFFINSLPICPPNLLESVFNLNLYSEK